MKRLLPLFVLCLSLVAANSNAQQLRDLVVPIPEKTWQRERPQGEFIDEMVYMIRLNNRYIVNKWYNESKNFDQQDGEYLNFKGRQEKHIRPTGHNIFVLAASMKLGLYDGSVTGVSTSDARAILHRLISSVAYRHISNSPGAKSAWGDQWQSASWAARIAMGAWIEWDRLPESTQELVSRMIVHEADRFNDYKVPYYCTRDGYMANVGDSKAEENSWNSLITTLAMLMMPDHDNYDIWRAKSIELQLSAYAAPKDMVSRKRVDGVVLREILNGSNVNSDGTVINHNRLHPDYMTSIMNSVSNKWASIMAGVKPLKSSTYNGDLIYRALTVERFNGKTIYQTNDDGTASHTLYFPEGNDWGGQRQANYWLMDIMAHTEGWAKRSDPKPMEWAIVRSKEMKRMMDRNTTGEYYKDLSEDRFYTREEWIGQHLLSGYIAMWLD